MVVESTAISEQTGVVSVLSFNQVSKDFFLDDDAHKQLKNWLDSFGLKWKSSIVVSHPTSFWPKEFPHIALLFFRICIFHLPVLSFLYDIISVEALVTLEQYRAARKQEKINSAWGEKSLCSVCMSFIWTPETRLWELFENSKTQRCEKRWIFHSPRTHQWYEGQSKSNDTIFIRRQKKRTHSLATQFSILV